MKVQTKIKIERFKIGCKKLCLVLLGIVIGACWFFVLTEGKEFYVSSVARDVVVIAPLAEASTAPTDTDNGVKEGEANGGQPATSLSIEETIQKIAKEYNFNWKILYAICLKESNCNSEAIGDEGKALGYYQIHYRMHKVSEKEAKDLQFSTEWTLKRLLKHSHLGEYEMIRSHNGLVSWNNYYVEDVYKIMEKL